MPLALFLAYPLLVHLGVLLQLPLLRALALLCLYVAIFIQPLRLGSLGAWLGLAAAAVLVFGLMLVGGEIYALYLPPLALTALTLAAFVRSLLPGRTALITQFANFARGPLDPAMQAHTRHVTWIWTMTLALMLIIILVLSVFGPHAWWSWFTNVIAYVVMGALLMLDYLYRRWRLPAHDGDGFLAHLRDVVRSARSVKR